VQSVLVDDDQAIFGFGDEVAVVELEGGGGFWIGDFGLRSVLVIALTPALSRGERGRAVRRGKRG
jgi:hypothetical protein